MSTSSSPLPENSGGPVVTEPETMNVKAMENVAEEEDVAAPAQPSLEYVDPAKSRRRFGLRGSAPYQPIKGNDLFNYEEKYPEDAYSEEMGPNARVFRTYIDERAIHDTNMVEEARDGVDVLLVFAGLFSAVVTTFVAQTSQSLQVDYTEMSANLLFEMINIQRAIGSGASLDTVAPSPLNPNITFIASTTSVWVNGLWFTSLALSLTTALVSVLVKQWLHHYMDLPSGTPRDRSLLQQFRFTGLQKWRVLVIIGLLPVLMHTALAIFFVGLVIFLGPLRDSIAWVVGVITAVAYTAYLMAHILPLIFPQCPYRTSLCDLLYLLYSRVMPYAVHNLMCCGVRFHDAPWKDLKSLESDAVQSVSGDLSVEALHGLFSMTSNPTVRSIVLQAIGGSHPALQSKVQSLFSDIGLIVSQSCAECLARPSSISRKLLPGLEAKLERLLRCKLFLSDASYIALDFLQTEDFGTVPSIKALIVTHRGYYREGNLLMKEVASNGATAFSRYSDDEYWVFHPLVWTDLITNAAENGVFSPVYIGTQDSFAIDICCAVLRAFWRPHSEDKDATSMVQPSAAAIPFHHAVCKYLYSDMTAYLLKMFAVFVRPLNLTSIEPSLRILLVFAEFLMSRLPLGRQEKHAATVDLHALATTFEFIWYHGFRRFYEADAAVFDVLDRFITINLKFIPIEAGHLHVKALAIYSGVAYTRYHTLRLPRSLEVVVDLMLDHYNSSDNVSVGAGDIITRGLREGSPTMFSVFRTAQCLEYFGHHGYRPWLRELIAGYLSIFEHHSNSRIEASVVQGHMEYLYTPDILFDVCSILAIGSHNLHEEDRRKQIKRNILSLVRIRRDAPVWEDCRYRLEQLLEEDGMGFFYRQTRIDGIKRVSLSAEEIAEQRKYIRFAIEILNAFFSGTLDDGPVSVRSP
ncbi:hypothetical protein EDD18DRAFT_1346413 [Armillaria luteobubalina]|uniref:DUF6535 domain-containing protein n=1 Tax=Armillaria luteobubalina TaxID=153913 RepID=A0AA39V310_9AGAR|nr:hypothetical protein EDD18DRAFT_1346413 [Armillaria luteobubalina]